MIAACAVMVWRVGAAACGRVYRDVGCGYARKRCRATAVRGRRTHGVCITVRSCRCPCCGLTPRRRPSLRRRVASASSAYCACRCAGAGDRGLCADGTERSVLQVPAGRPCPPVIVGCAARAGSRPRLHGVPGARVHVAGAGRRRRLFREVGCRIHADDSVHVEQVLTRVCVRGWRPL